MTILRRIFLILSLVTVGAAVWALMHNGRLGSYTFSGPILITVCIVAGLIAAVALVTETIMLLSNIQHPEPEDPPLPPPVVYKPPVDPEPDDVIQKTMDAADQAEEYLAQTRHRISVTIEEDPEDPESDDPKTPPTIA
jgi:hypothetical protein